MRIAMIPEFCGRSVWINGDLYVYTGRSEMLHGGRFYATRDPETGRERMTQRPAYLGPAIPDCWRY